MVQVEALEVPEDYHLHLALQEPVVQVEAWEVPEDCYLHMALRGLQQGPVREYHRVAWEVAVVLTVVA